MLNMYVYESLHLLLISNYEKILCDIISFHPHSTLQMLLICIKDSSIQNYKPNNLMQNHKTRNW